MSVSRPCFSRFYLRLSRAMEEGGVADRRRELLDGLAGRVIEVGAGNGLNFRHYPPEVTEVLAVEPEPRLRAAAKQEARTAAVPVRVREGLADSLPADDESFDAGVTSLVLCTVPDQDRALHELFRVIRPGGELRFYEHVRSRGAPLARIQRAVDLLWPYLAGGCHTSRDTVAAIERAGFQMTSLRRFRFPEMRLLRPWSPHVLGSARRQELDSLATE